LITKQEKREEKKGLILSEVISLYSSPFRSILTPSRVAATTSLDVAPQRQSSSDASSSDRVTMTTAAAGDTRNIGNGKSASKKSASKKSARGAKHVGFTGISEDDDGGDQQQQQGQHGGGALSFGRSTTRGGGGRVGAHDGSSSISFGTMNDDNGVFQVGDFSDDDEKAEYEKRVRPPAANGQSSDSSSSGSGSTLAVVPGLDILESLGDALRTHHPELAQLMGVAAADEGTDDDDEDDDNEDSKFEENGGGDKDVANSSGSGGGMENPLESLGQSAFALWGNLGAMMTQVGADNSAVATGTAGGEGAAGSTNNNGSGDGGGGAPPSVSSSDSSSNTVVDPLEQLMTSMETSFEEFDPTFGLLETYKKAFLSVGLLSC
jgi:hypothetical protein